MKSRLIDKKSINRLTIDALMFKLFSQLDVNLCIFCVTLNKISTWWNLIPH